MDSKKKPPSRHGNAPSKSNTHQKGDEEVIFGLKAALAAGEKRPNSIIRVYFEQRRREELQPLLTELAKRKRAYHIVTKEELEKITSSVHHEGVSLLVRKRPSFYLRDLTDLPTPHKVIAALVGVTNPHNLGAIARSAAHFGVTALAVVDLKAAPPLGAIAPKRSISIPPSSYRIAQGGLEHLSIYSLNLSELLSLKRNGYKLLAPTPHGGTPVSKFKFPPQSILLFGAEDEGLPEEVMKEADEIVNIPGSGKVESLNVSAAAAILLHAAA